MHDPYRRSGKSRNDDSAANHDPHIHGYELLRPIGQGAMGTVYKARQTATDRMVAIKVLSDGPGKDVRQQRRVLAAAESVLGFDHPNVVAIFDVGTWEGGRYIAEELIEGENLVERLAGAPQSERYAAELVEQMARALEDCHQRKIVHGNLKPVNILLDDHGVPQISDFGVATLSDEAGGRETELPSQPAPYTAPEMATGATKDIGPVADVYSLGAILYEMLTGRPPFLGEDRSELLNLLAEQEVVSPRRLRPTVSKELETICLKCLARKPERRYATAAALADDLRRFLDHQPLEARPEGAWERTWRWCQRQPVAAAAAVAGVAVVVGLLIGLAARASGLSTEKDRAAAEARSEATGRASAEKKARDALLKAQLAEVNLRRAEQEAHAARENVKQIQANATRQPPREPARRHDLYVTQIRLAKQAWDRGETAAVRQLLAPYREADKKDLRNFAWHYLWRASNSGAVLTLREHAQPVRQAAFTSDGAGVVTLSEDGVLALFDARSGQRQQQASLQHGGTWTLTGLASQQALQRSTSLKLTASGGWIAAFGSAIWSGDLRQIGEKRQVAEGKEPILELAISPDGKTLASSDARGEIVLRDLPEGRVLRQWRDAPARALAFSRDGKTLWSGNNYGKLTAWDPANGTALATESFGQAISALAVGPQARLVAVALADREGIVRLWEPERRAVRSELRGHQDEVTAVCFSPEGDQLLTASRDQTARLWNPTGSLLRTFRGHLGEVHSAAFAPDGQGIVTAGADRTAIVWAADTGREYEVLAGTPAQGWISDLTFTAGGDRLIAAGAGEEAEAFLTQWSLNDTAHPVAFQAPARAATAIACGPDGRWMAVGEESSLEATTPSRVRIWSLESGRVATTLTGLTGRINALSYAPDGRALATAVGDKDEAAAAQVRLWDIAAGSVRGGLTDLFGRVEAAFSPDGRYLATVASSSKRPGEIRLWNPNGELLGRIQAGPELENTTTSALSPDGQFLVTGHGNPAGGPEGAAIRIWDLTSRQLAATLPAAHSAGVTKVVFSRRGKLLASGDAGGNIRLWDFPARKLLPSQITTPQARIHSLTFDWLGERLASGADEKLVRVWHVDRASELARMELAVGVPLALRYSVDGNLLIGATSAGGLIAWDSQTYRPRALLQAEGNPVGRDGHAGEVTCALLSFSGRKLITGGVDKTLRLWDLETRKLEKTPFVCSQPVACLAVASNGHMFALGTGRYRQQVENGELMVCEFTSRDAPPNVRPLAEGVVPISVDFAPDGATLVACTVSSSGNREVSRAVTVYHLASGKQTKVATEQPRSVAISPDGRLLAVGSTAGEIELWTVESLGRAGARPRILSGHRNAVTALCFSPDRKVLVSGGLDKNVRVWDLDGDDELLVLKHNGAVERLRFSPDGMVLAAVERVDQQGGVRLWRAGEK